MFVSLLFFQRGRWIYVVRRTYATVGGQVRFRERQLSTAGGSIFDGWTSLFVRLKTKDE